MFRKVHEFVQCTKQRFQPKITAFCHFDTGCTTFKWRSAKYSTLYKTDVFRPTSACFVVFALGALLLRDFQQSARFDQNSVFSPRSASFVLFALGAPIWSDFQESARVCTKQCFQPKISTFVNSALNAPLFSDYQQSARVCTKQSV